MTDDPIAPPPTPPAATAMIPQDRLPVLEAYAAWLADAGTVRGLIGPREVPRLWDRHLLNCASLADVVPAGVTMADVGSGAGLPGLVVAIVRPDLHVTLIEPLLRRTTFLTEVCQALSLTNVEVVRGRADALHGKRSFGVVTSRAVAPLERLLEWSMPLVAAEGALVAMKGSSIDAEIETAAPTLARFGCAAPEVLRLGEGQLEETTVAVRVAWADPTRVSLPLSASSVPGSSSATSKRTRTTKSKHGRRRS